METNPIDVNLLPDLDTAEVSSSDIGWLYTYSMQNELSTLLRCSSYEGEARYRIERDIDDVGNMTEDLYKLTYTFLQHAQMDRISNGLTYNQADIINHIRKLR